MKKNSFELSFIALKNIVENDVPFRIAIKALIKNEKGLDNEVVSTVSMVLGANLRHYYLLEDLLKKEFEGIEGDDRFYLSIFLSDALFSKKFEYKFLEKELNKRLANKVNNLEELFNKYSSLDSINVYRDQLKEGTISEFDYLSIRYNTPLWLIKMWNKHFPKSLRLILKSNIHECDTSLAVNTKRMSLEEVLKDPIFKKSNYEDMVLYSGKKAKNLPLVQEQVLYPLRESERYVFDELELNEEDRIVIYSEQKGNNIPLKVKELIKRTNWVKYLTNSHEDYAKTRKYVASEMDREKSSVNNFITYRVDRKDINICLIDEEEKNDIFFLLPLSSNFDEIRHSPDYLLHFNKDSLDELINAQKSLLNEADKYLKPGGRIVYIVPTLCNKEGRNLINSFLKDKNYELIKDRQFFPYSEYRSALYFAIIKKKGQSQDD